MGYVRAADVAPLTEIDRFCPVLVRTGSCRFTCAIQYLPHLGDAIRIAGDYVRDVQIVASPEYLSAWTPEPNQIAQINRNPGKL